MPKNGVTKVDYFFQRSLKFIGIRWLTAFAKDNI